MLAAFLTVTWQSMVEGFSADTSRITWLILIAFVYGFLLSLRAAWLLEAEYKSLRIMEIEEGVVDPNASDISALFDAALERARRGERINVRNLVSAYAAKLKGRVDNLNVVSGMLITIGLLGTILGLIMTVTGLDEVLQSSSTDFRTMKDGMIKTVSGMGTAFYTTLFGALLGGVVLRVLASEMKKTSMGVVADALRFSELFVAPHFQRQASEALVALEDRIVKVRGQLDTLSSGFSGVIDTIDSKHGVLEEGLTHIIATVEETNARASERSEKLVESIARAIDDSSRHADERVTSLTTAISESSLKNSEVATALVESINASVEQTNHATAERTEGLLQSMAEANEHMSTQLSELVETSKATVEETNRLANERVAATFERMDAMLEEAKTRADERAEALAQSIAKTLDEASSTADERLKAVVASVEAATARTTEKADAELASFVKNVELSIDSSRKNAEERLGAKASDLAGKLNEAAGMLSSLVQSAAAAEHHKED